MYITQRCRFASLPWLQIFGDNIFLTLEQQFPVTLFILDSVYVQPPITNISTGQKCSNKLILHNSLVLFRVVTINNLLLLYNNEITVQICIDFSAENARKLPLAAAKASCNALSAITDWGVYCDVIFVYVVMGDWIHPCVTVWQLLSVETLDPDTQSELKRWSCQVTTLDFPPSLPKDNKPRMCECRDLKEISGELVGWKDPTNPKKITKIYSSKFAMGVSLRHTFINHMEHYMMS